MSSGYTVLLVEGRKPTAEYLAPVFIEQGYNVIVASTRRDALARVSEATPEAIVLDSPSLRFSPRRFCDALREADILVPVLMLVPGGEKIDRSVGARAYMRYPFSHKRLLNRVSRLLPTSEDEVLRAGDIKFNTKQRCVVVRGHESPLTPKQALLLEIFLRNQGEVLSRVYLMKQVWDTDYMGDTRTLDVHIHWVRKAIEEDPKSPIYLRTIRRVGYCFDVPAEEK